MSSLRRESRRVRELARARAEGDHDARVMWMLPIPRHRPRPDAWGPRTDRDRDRRRELRRSDVFTISEQRDGLIYGSRYQLPWLRPIGFAQRCRPAPSGFPPALEDRLRTLCELYVTQPDPYPLRSTFDAEPFRPAPAAEAAEATPDGVVAPDRVVADAEDFDRWFEAGDAYRAELDRAESDLNRYWGRRGYRLSLASWRQRRALRRWQAMLTAAYDRLAAASDRYRQVLVEMTEAVDETARAHEDLTARVRRLHDWESRRIWRLVAHGEGLLIRRSDVAGDEPADAGTPRPFAEVYESAKSERHVNLHPVDWDDESLRRCDSELADLADGHPPVGNTRSGLPMARPAPTSFADWFDERFGSSHQYLSDPATLERDRALREQWRATPRDSGSSSPRIGGYHTDPGSHYGIHF
jgi:hypothetical protein